MSNTSSKKVASSPLSNFVQRTSLSEQKRIYKKAMKAASQIQNSIVEKAKAIA